MAATSKQRVVQLFERKYGKNYHQEIDKDTLFSILGQLFEQDLFTKCDNIFSAVDTQHSGKVRFDAVLNHESFMRLIQTRSMLPKNRKPLQSYESVDTFPDEYADDIENDDDEKNNTDRNLGKRVWSYEDVELVQMQVAELFRNSLQDSQKDTVDFAQFCAVVKDLLPSSVAANNQRIRQVFDTLDGSQRGLISYHEFLKTNVFVGFLRTMLGVEISEYTSNRQRQQTWPRTESVKSLHGDLLFRALSIRHPENRAAITSDADTIQHLEHWINEYGKPAQLKSQQLQLRLDGSEEYRHILQQQIEELEYELSEFRSQNAMLSEQTTELEQFSAGLEQQMSFMHDENEHLKSNDRHSQKLSVEFDDLQLRLSEKVEREQKTLKENDVLKKMNFDNAEFKAKSEQKISRQRQMLKKLWTERGNLNTKNERLNAVVAKQERELEALQSQVGDQSQMIVNMQQSMLQQQGSQENVGRKRTQTQWMNMRSNETMEDQLPDEDGTQMRRTDTIDTTDADNIELTMLDRDDSPLYDDIDHHEAGASYSMVSVSTAYVESFKSEIGALRQELQYEQTKREALLSQIDALQLREKSLQEKLDMVDKDVEQQVVLKVKACSSDDDDCSPDELQPFVVDGREDGEDDSSSVYSDLQVQTRRRRPKCCFFLFGY